MRSGIPFVLLVLLSLMTAAVYAEPAPPFPVAVRQPDGRELQVRIIGDEWALHYETMEGYTILRRDDGWWVFAKADTQGELIPTNLVAGRDNPGRLRVEKHLHPSPRDPAGEGCGDRSSRVGSIRGPMTDGPLSLPASTQAVVFMVEFTDKSPQAGKDQAYYESLLWTGSDNMTDYWEEVSYGNFTVTGTVHANWLSLPCTIASCDADEWGQLIPNLVSAAQSDGVDWSDYD